MEGFVFTSSQRETMKFSTVFAERTFSDLVKKPKIPDHGWPEQMLELFLMWLAVQDTNNRMDKMPIGAGEREGRVACSLVRRLHFGMSHGIGRSGNLTEVQPKALGSSAINLIGNKFAVEAIRSIGISTCAAALVVPVA
ncbi:hypothetical protein AB6A40_006291, partial [Gnathostoma spinigerum]